MGDHQRAMWEAQLGLVSAAYDSSSAFAGFAIHDAARYAAMRP